MFASSTKAQERDAWLLLDILWEGLEHLCQQVERAEMERAQSLGLSKEAAQNFSYCDFGSEPGDSMVCNYFVWYANVLYNFLLIFEEAFLPSENLEREFRNVLRWRHEVAAHALWALRKRALRKRQSRETVRHNNRGAAKQNMSILLFPEFSAGHFAVGGVTILPPGDASPSYTPERKIRFDWQWGLVRTHQRLKAIVEKYV